MIFISNKYLSYKEWYYYIIVYKIDNSSIQWHELWRRLKRISMRKISKLYQLDIYMNIVAIFQ